MAAPAVASRTIESLPPLAWALLSGWAFAGWVISSLKPAVEAMNDATKPANVRAAVIISTLVASMAFGIACGLYLLIEARWDGRVIGALYAYLGAFAGGFTGMKGMEWAIEKGKGVIEVLLPKREKTNDT